MTTITVFGAATLQGRTAVEALCRDGFKVKAAIEDTSSPTCQRLKDLGAEVVVVDFNNKGTVQEALQGSQGCYLVTYSDFCHPQCLQVEVNMGKVVADTCERLRIDHLVFSTLPSVREVSGLEARHADAKAFIQNYIKQNTNVPLTCVMVPFCFEYLLQQFRPIEDIIQRCYRLNIPMGRVPLECISMEDMGEVVKQVFKNKSRFVGKSLCLAADKITVAEMAAILNKHLQPTKFIDGQITPAEYRDFGFPGSSDWANYLALLSNGHLRKNLDLTRELNGRVLNFEAWVVKNKGKFQPM